MPIELMKRGQTIDLTKNNPSLKKISVCLGWDTNKYDGRADFDLDVSVFLAQDNGKVRDDNDFVYYNNLQHSSGAIIHTGDERTGGLQGDDEVINVEFQKIPEHISKLAFAVTIHDAEPRKQNFGQVSNAYVRVDNGETNEQILRYDLGEDFSIETAVVICEVYKYNGEWKFKAIGSGYQNGLAGLIQDYGLQVK